MATATSSLLCFSEAPGLSATEFVSHAYGFGSQAKSETVHVHFSCDVATVIPALTARLPNPIRGCFRDYFYTLKTQDLLQKNFWLRRRVNLADQTCTWSLKYDVSKPSKFNDDKVSMNAIKFVEETKVESICAILKIQNLDDLVQFATYTFSRLKFPVPDFGSIVIDSTRTGYGEYYTIATIVVDVRTANLGTKIPLGDFKLNPGAHLRSKVVEHLWLGDTVLYEKIQKCGHVSDDDFYDTDICYSNVCPLGKIDVVEEFERPSKGGAHQISTTTYERDAKRIDELKRLREQLNSKS